ncbi:MAG: pro-sigmaK processing inhibitor BofA family protein [Methanoregula sp.]|jgi:inhibitor of the pro-sigma K processing machinery
MDSVLISIIIIIALLAIAYYLVKKLAVLVVNGVLGLLFLFVLNSLQVMQWIGKPDLGYSLATILICAIGGLPGVLILVLLSILGVTI